MSPIGPEIERFIKRPRALIALGKNLGQRIRPVAKNIPFQTFLADFRQSALPDIQPLFN